MSKVRWHGETSHKTSEYFFFLDDAESASDEQCEQLRVVVETLRALTTMKDANGHPLVRLIAERLDHTSPFIAYRFTSDFSYDVNSGPLVSLGASLGRGGFDPFSNRYTFKKYIA